MRAKLTNRLVESAKATGKQYIMWDTALSSFCVRVNPRSKTFLVQRKVLGHQRKVRIGRSDHISVEDARKRAAEILAAFDSGKEPSEKKEALTFGQLCDLYISNYSAFEIRPGVPRKKDWKNEKGRLRHCGVSIWNRPISSIDRPSLSQLHREITKHAPVEANRFLAAVRKMFNFADVEGYFEGRNPVQGIPFNPEQSRSIFIQPKELPAVLLAIKNEQNIFVRHLFLFVFFSGCRPDEARLAKWEDLNLDASLWHKPNTKNGTEHILPLTDYLIEVIRATPKVDGNPYIFVGLVKGKPIHTYAKNWAKVRRVANVTAVLRDLRRTFSTYMRECGFSKEDIRAVLNHADHTADETDKYARTRLFRIREAMQTTTDYILSMSQK